MSSEEDLHIRVPKSLRDRLRNEAEATGNSESAVARTAMDAYLRDRGRA